MAYTYANLADIKRYVDYRIVVQLTNDDDAIDPTNVSLIDETVLQTEENSAARTIDNYLRNVYDPLPLTGADLTPEIVEIAARLTHCNLWRRRGDEPQQITDMRRELLARLKQMGAPVPDENRSQEKSDKAMPARLAGRGHTETIFDYAGMFDGLPGRGTHQMPIDADNENNV